jgi:membrane protease YdiL (CAAX protease family)
MSITTSKKKNPQQGTFSLLKKLIESLKVVIGSAVIFVGAQFLAMILLGIFLSAAGGFDAAKIENLLTDSILTQFVLVLMIEALVVAGVWVMVQFYDRKLKTVFNLQKPTLSLLWKVVKVFLLYLLVSWAAMLLISQTLPRVDTEMEQDIGFKNAAGWQLSIVFLALCVAVPIGEELMFRGLLFKGLKRYVGYLIAATITTLLFGAAHLEFIGGKPLNWAAGIDTAILSVFLIKLYKRTGTITAPIMLHALKNSLAFVFLFLVK